MASGKEHIKELKYWKEKGKLQTVVPEEFQKIKDKGVD